MHKHRSRSDHGGLHAVAGTIRKGFRSTGREVSRGGEGGGGDRQTVHATQDHVYEAIIDTASKKGCDLIFMASHGRKGISALVLGSETYKVLSHSKIPVLVRR